MSVKSAPLENGQLQGKPSAVVSRAQLEKTRGPVERFLAIVVLLIGWLGTVVAFHGSWPALLSAFSIERTAAALVVQGVLTWSQWSYGRDWRVAYTSRAIDAALTAAGYAPLWLAGLVAWLAAQGIVGGATIGPWTATGAGLMAWLISWAACLLPAWYPESRLIK